VLLVHARAVVHVRIHLAYIVKVAMRRTLLGQKLLVSVQHDVEVELLLQQLQALVREGADMAGRAHLEQPEYS
jgi:hypothetical protein